MQPRGSGPKRNSPSNDSSKIRVEQIDARAMEHAMQCAVRTALTRHKKLGQSIAIWSDGRVVELQPHEIPEFDEPNS